MSLRTCSGATRLIFALVLTMLLVSGCATVNTQGAGGHPAIQQARALVQSGTALSGSARKANDQQIEKLIAGLDNPTLAREAAALKAGDPIYNYVGRALLRRGLALPRPFDRGAWRFNAGNRPAAESDGYRPPVKLAVLLPLSGSLSSVASPVRDGLLAGYYGESRRRPDIVFYDTVGSASGALSAYDKAVAEGNDFVLGPLGRDEVGALFARASLPVPLLALNRSSQNPPAGNASFSLSPEDEGLAAAEYLIGRGARRVLAIASDDDTQRRAVVSLRQRLTERGGTLVDTVGEGTGDFAPFAQKGIDAVFLATKGSTARTLMPKLALAGLAGKPRVATSQLLTGTGKAEQDRILDGVAFPIETFTNRAVQGLPTAGSVGTLLPSARGPGAKLFAFGYDAWLLTAYLEHLALSADGHVNGATGTLRIDGFGNVQRMPAWSTFSGGQAVPLADASRR